MSEPKYIIGETVATLHHGTKCFFMISGVWKERGNWLYASSSFGPIKESNILYAVTKIVPCYGEVYCKDCKHCKIDYTDDPTDESAPYLKFEDCPISDWFEHVWSVQESGLYEEGGYICDFDTLQPPPNCNCFEPKEAE